MRAQNTGSANTEAARQYQSSANSIMRLLGQGRVDEAESLCLAFSRSYPQSSDALLLLGKVRQMQGRFDEMLQLIETALGRDPDNVGLQLQFAGACQFCGHHDKTLAQLKKVEPAIRNNAKLLQQVARLYLDSLQHADAHRCYRRAAELDAKNPHALYNLASSFLFLGEVEKAEAALSKAIAIAPDHYNAWHNRSTLRKQTSGHNHIPELKKALRALAPGSDGETELCYALAREYEDLGKDEESFSYLKHGADSYRRQLKYDVQTDVALMQRIAQRFDRAWAEKAKAAAERRGPIFVLGLPRSGTTLVDRILSSHSGVRSMGEIDDFEMAVSRLCWSLDKRQLFEASVSVDPDQLGEDYLRSVASYGFGAPFFIDKSLANSFYIGLIAKALPGASIIHVRRHPVDLCLAIYRTLFKSGNPYSYDLDDLAEYFIAYDRLMQHWETLFPGLVLDVSYEELVEDQERVSREIVAHCGLDWEPACLAFEHNRAPVSTWSAAQVRKPIYRDAVARWRRFETQLAPLIRRLEQAGVKGMASE